MGKQKLKGKDLRKIGFVSDKRKSMAINIMAQHYKHLKKTEKLALLENVQANPKNYLEDPYLAPLAESFMPVVKKEDYTVYQMENETKPYKVFGKKFINQNALLQMDLAMSLPIAEKGAMMPDAHAGYGIPIGGVIATKNEVIPYAVGLDIGCRMALSIFDLPADYAKRQPHKLKTALMEETHFGVVKKRTEFVEHAILDRPEFGDTEVLRTLRNKAASQLGTSGGGNHFVEFGEVELTANNQLGLPAGTYFGLVSHSGSRGLGATVANYYKTVAMDVCKLPKQVQQLAWLDLDSAEGMEYWMAMNLAGDYAKACHDVIHQRLAKAIGGKILATVENHHNFAWKEKQADGSELIVHRKGATPAKEGELGIIPGSMATSGYIVSGKGNSNSLFSASHGAGRRLSRTKAKGSYTKSEMRKELKKAGVTLIGGGLDEAPFAYKDIEQVMQNQQELVNIEGKFTPLIVRMCKD